MGRPLNKRYFTDNLDSGINLTVKLPNQEPEVLTVVEQKSNYIFVVKKDGVLYDVTLRAKPENELLDFEAGLYVTTQTGDVFPVNKITQHLLSLKENGTLLPVKWGRTDDNDSGIGQVSPDRTIILDAVEEVVLPSFDFLVSNTGNPEAHYTTIESALADTGAVLAGSTLYIEGIHTITNTLVIDRQINFTSHPILSSAGSIITTGADTDPVTMVSVTAGNVTIENLTLRHNKTTNTSVETVISLSGGGYPQTEVVSPTVRNCAIYYQEMGISVRADDFTISGNSYYYVGADTANTVRPIIVYRSVGTCQVSNNTFDASNGVVRAIAVTSTTGTSPYEVLSGTLTIENNNTVGSVNQFYIQDNFDGTAGSFNLVTDSNDVNVSNGAYLVYGTTTNFGDVFSSVTLINNSFGYDTQGTSKGLFGIDGSGVFRSSPLLVTQSNNNIIASDTQEVALLRSDYTEAVNSTGGLIAYKAGMFGVNISMA